MKKKLIALIALIAGAFAFSSCTLSDEGEYLIYYELQTQLGDDTNTDERHKVIQDYFKERLNFEDGYKFYGSSSEASAYGLNIYKQDREKIIDDEVKALFTMEGDGARLIMRLSGKNLNTPLAWTDWYYGQSEASNPDE